MSFRAILLPFPIRVRMPGRSMTPVLSTSTGHSMRASGRFHRRSPLLRLSMEASLVTPSICRMASFLWVLPTVDLMPGERRICSLLAAASSVLRLLSPVFPPTQTLDRTWQLPTVALLPVPGKPMEIWGKSSFSRKTPTELTSLNPLIPREHRAETALVSVLPRVDVGLPEPVWSIHTWLSID